MFTFDFDLSVIDIILTVAVVILFALFFSIRRSQNTPMSGTTAIAEQRQSKKEIETRDERKPKKKSGKESPASFQGCIHEVGYLQDLPPNTPVPDECFGCPNVMRCLFPNQQVASQQ